MEAVSFRHLSLIRFVNTFLTGFNKTDITNSIRGEDNEAA